MGLKANFTPEGFRRELERRMKAIEQIILRRLQYVGEECVNYARAHGNYQDQTGNLRSSIGYVIYAHNRVVSDGGFEQVKGGSEGAHTGRAFALRKLQELNVEGYVLVVVAGMNYGYYVETTGRDVLTGAEHLAKREMNAAITRIRQMIKAA